MELVRPSAPGELMFLIARISARATAAPARLLDLTYSMVECWVSAGIADEPRRDELVLFIFTAIWQQADRLESKRKLAS